MLTTLLATLLAALLLLAGLLLPALLAALLLTALLLLARLLVWILVHRSSSPTLFETLLYVRASWELITPGLSLCSVVNRLFLFEENVFGTRGTAVSSRP